MPAIRGYLEIIIKLWEWTKENLTIEEINNKLLFGTDNARWTVWQLAAECGNLETLQKIWEFAKKNLTTEEINNKLLFGTENAGWTVWQLATKCGN